MKINLKRILPIAIVLVFFVVTAVIVVVNMSREEKEEKKEENKEENKEEQDEGMNIVGMEELGELGMIDAGLPIILTCGNYYGHGFVIERNEAEIIIAAPKHLLSENETVTVTLEDGSSLEGAVHKLSDEYDVGYVRIDRTIINESQSELLFETITANESYYESLKKDDVVKLRTGKDTWQEGTLAEPFFFSADVNSYAALMEMTLEHGQSGMPVYDKNNVCVGMIIAGSKTQALYLPVTIIFTEYFIY